MDSSGHIHTAGTFCISARELACWREPRTSGAAFAASMLVLVCLALFSVISVCSYPLLALLCFTITFRIYKSILQAVKKSNQGHPFRSLMEKDISISQEAAHRISNCLLGNINKVLMESRRLLLVENVVDSLKLVCVVWFMTYVGAAFNALTLLIMADVIFFSAHPLYRRYEVHIKRLSDSVRIQLQQKLAKLQENLPGGVKWNQRH